jgi:hypothetical protein
MVIGQILKLNLNSEERALVAAGLRYVEWRIRVLESLKGKPPAEIVARRAFGQDGGRETDLPDLATGQKATLWLEPGRAYTRTPYFILVEGVTA